MILSKTISRSYLRNSYLNIAGYFKKPSKGIHFLYGHYISNGNEDAEVFYRLLEKLKKYVKFIYFEDACELVYRKQTVKEPLVCFSFDDGFEECYTKIYPVLKDFKTNACIFVIPNYIDGSEEYQSKLINEKNFVNKKPASWEILTEMVKNGFIVGSHTMDHLNLNIKDKDELICQIVKSKDVIEKKLNIICDHFVWPYGRKEYINQDALEIILAHYSNVFVTSRSRYYLSFNNRVINRSHFEGNWSLNSVKYFLSKKKLY